MDFVAIVDQVITLLRQRGRMTYRTLQRQFQLDDDALHDLTEELLYAHPEVRDDAGRGFVLTRLRWGCITWPPAVLRSAYVPARRRRVLASGGRSGPRLPGSAGCPIPAGWRWRAAAP
jgi:hypothetical protein